MASGRPDIGSKAEKNGRGLSIGSLTPPIEVRQHRVALRPLTIGQVFPFGQPSTPQRPKGVGERVAAVPKERADPAIDGIEGGGRSGLGRYDVKQPSPVEDQGLIAQRPSGLDKMGANGRIIPVGLDDDPANAERREPTRGKNACCGQATNPGHHDDVDLARRERRQSVADPEAYPVRPRGCLDPSPSPAKGSMCSVGPDRLRCPAAGHHREGQAAVIRTDIRDRVAGLSEVRNGGKAGRKPRQRRALVRRHLGQRPAPAHLFQFGTQSLRRPLERKACVKVKCEAEHGILIPGKSAFDAADVAAAEPSTRLGSPSRLLKSCTTRPVHRLGR